MSSLLLHALAFAAASAAFMYGAGWLYVRVLLSVGQARRAVRICAAFTAWLSVAATPLVLMVAARAVVPALAQSPWFLLCFGAGLIPVAFPIWNKLGELRAVGFFVERQRPAV